LAAIRHRCGKALPLLTGFAPYFRADRIQVRPIPASGIPFAKSPSQDRPHRRDVDATARIPPQQLT
jgi:hypothetical protein